MHIKKLNLKNYRNYESLEIDFSSGVNVLYGNNGAGKTNILEAIYLTSTTKSHRGSNDKELIRFSSEEAQISSLFQKKDIDSRIDILLRKTGKKSIAINKIPQKKASELLGVFQCVLFSPEDLRIIKDSPAIRRRFLDRELCVIEPSYIKYLNSYTKILNKRRITLEHCFKNRDDILLDTLDEQLVLYGTKIIETRKKYIDYIQAIIKEIHKSISSNKEDITVLYKNNIDIEQFLEKLKLSRDLDIKRGITSVGPHRDDINFRINNEESKKYSSQGQQRTIAITLKLSEIEIINRIYGEYPCLLLDDVLSELDVTRQSLLLERFKSYQTIITSTGVETVKEKNLNIDKLYFIEGGKVRNGN